MDSIQQAGEEGSLAWDISVNLRVGEALQVQPRALHRGQRGCH